MDTVLVHLAAARPELRRQRQNPAEHSGREQIIGLNFAPFWSNNNAPGKAFDFWIDDVSFDVAPEKYSDSGIRKIVTKAMFDGAYAARRGGQALNPLYANAYEDFAKALDDPRFSRFGREGSLEDRKREVAAFMAHLVQESGSLAYSTEIAPGSNYCDPPAPSIPAPRGKRTSAAGRCS